MQPSKTFGSAWATIIAAASLFLTSTFPHQQPLAQSLEHSDALNPQSIPSTSDFLDGLHFKAGIVKAEDGSGNALGDVLIFSDGKFSSVVCKRYNFTAAPYWVRTEGEAIHFLAELNSPTDGKMVWKGTITGDKLKGTMRWTRTRWYWTIDAEHNIEGEVDISAQSVSVSPQ